MAVGAPQAARMLESLDHALAADLSRIPYAGTSIVTLAYRREDVGHALDGFGFVVPAVENRRILAGSFSSVKFSGRRRPTGFWFACSSAGPAKANWPTWTTNSSSDWPSTNCVRS